MVKQANTNPQAPLTDEQMVYQLEGKPKLTVALPLGLQHVLAMFASNLAPMLIIAGILGSSGADKVLMMQAAMVVSGLTTFVQLYPLKIGNRQIGAGLPIVMGTSFAFVPTAASVAGIYGTFGAVLGGAMIGSLSEGIIGFFYKYLERFFPPLVIGCTLITIGVHLLDVGRDYFAGGTGAKDYGSWQNLSIAFLTFIFIVVLQRFGKGILKTAALLFGLVFGYCVAFFFGKVDFATISQAGWFSLPLPLHFRPEFHLDAIISFAALYVVSGLETIGNTSGITVAAFDREATQKETSGAIMADAGGSFLASIFGALPNTAFGQNAGIVSMTGVVNKWCIATGAFVLTICGFLPKLGAIFASIPNAVLGGSLISVFAMIFINGIKLIAKSGFSERNVLVLGITFAMGLGLAGHADAIKGLWGPLRFIFEDGVAATCMVAILVNILFPIDKDDRGKADKAAHEEILEDI